MRNILPLSVLLSLPTVEVAAQNIQGRIVDNNNKPLAMSTVVLQKADSTFIGGTTSGEDGRFTIQCD